VPELPEVETTRKSLLSLVRGRTIDSVEVFYDGMIKNMPAPEFCRRLAGQMIADVKRRGKYLLFHLTGGYTLVVHLRMTGQLVFSGPEVLPARNTRLVFNLSDGGQLKFMDTRKLGFVYLVPTGCWDQVGRLAELGPEPLEEGFTLEAFSGILRNRKGIIKSFLLDQRRIAGIGNIYADEILFAAGINPKRSIKDLEPAELERIYEAVRDRLKEGLRFRGTSIRDYVDGMGERGGFQEYLKVYNRAGKPCPRCGATLAKCVVAGRGTVFCPQCQR
jgi:formamidopyrimidine-DNA glycosylase